MNDIKDKLGRIKSIFTEKQEVDINCFPLEWIEIQKKIIQEIADIIESLIIPHNKNRIFVKDLKHKLRGTWSDYSMKYGFVQRGIDRGENIEIDVAQLYKTKQMLIENIDVFCKIDSLGLISIKEQLTPITSKLIPFDGDIDSNDLLQRRDSQYQLYDDIQVLCEEVREKASTLVGVSITQYDHWIHDVMRSGKVYISTINNLIKCIESNSSDDEKMASKIQHNDARDSLITTIRSLDTIDDHPILQENALSVLCSHIGDGFATIQDDIIDHEDIYVYCSDHVFLSGIIYELKENYRKYGTKGEMTIKIENNQLLIFLSNKKKAKNPKDFSSSQGIKIIKKYLDILGGSIDYNYTTDDCWTKIRLPVHTI